MQFSEIEGWTAVNLISWLDGKLGTLDLSQPVLRDWLRRVNKVPAFDSEEEFLCAQVTDQLPDVEFWIRNVERRSDSFSLPTTLGRFYPDFVALLRDGTRLVVEYKGQHLLNNPDTKEKQDIGELWAKESNGVFVMPSIPSGTRERKNCIEQAIMGAIANV